MKKFIYISILFSFALKLSAQHVAYNEPITIVETVIIDNDTLLVASFPECNIVANKMTKREKLRYNSLKRRVMTVYPYAKMAGKMLLQYEGELALIEDEHKRKRLTKKIEKDLEDEFSGELSELTISQGLILIKLIDRETGSTSFEVLEEFRGDLSAFLWQGMARLFGHNLKDDYEEDGDEKMIEDIMVKIESGDMPYYVREKKQTAFVGK
jgi:hypothetical protein